MNGKRVFSIRALRRALSAVLCAAALLTLLPAMPARADGTGGETGSGSSTAGARSFVSPQNTYVLRVVTGDASTDDIQFFNVRYKDSSGITRAQLIFPTRDDLASGYKKAVQDLAAGGITASAKSALDSLAVWGYEETTNYTNVTALESNRVNEFYFKPRYSLRSVESIDVFARYNAKAKNLWTCQFMGVYRVERLYDLAMTGHFSDQLYFSFYGSCLARLSNQGSDKNVYPNRLDFTWNSGSDFLFHCAPGNGSAWGLTVPTGDAAVYDVTDAASILFNIDLADVYGAGIEALAAPYGKSALKDIGVFECLGLEISYTDADGVDMTVNIPCVLSALDWSTRAAGTTVTTDSAVCGVFQQGESLAFDAALPGFENFNYVRLRLGASAMDAMTLSVIKDPNADDQQERVLNAEETISVTGIQMYYLGEDVTATASLEDGFIRPKVEGSWAYYYTSSAMEGQTIYQSRDKEDNNCFTVPFHETTGRESRYPKESGTKFVVRFKTDDAAGAATADDFLVTFFYHCTDGLDKATAEVSVRDGARTYVGYLPGADGKDASYKVGACSGGYLYFTFNASHVDYFTGCKISMKSDAGDDWQTTELKIWQVKTGGYGERRCSWETVTDAQGNVISDRNFYRDCTVTDISPTLNEAVLIQPGDAKTITFRAGESSTVTEESINWESLRYSMSYEEAKQNLGFTKNRMSYNVTVQVSNSSAAKGVGDDCGSQNWFYFQLIFQDGTSGYVLANQQLSGDGFATGAKQSFTVTVNQDYGGVSAIRIIPEDQSENTDAFDKLRLDWIEVAGKADENGLSMTYRANVDDWISIDYQDEGAKASVSGQKGRTEAEIARTFPVTSRGYSVNLLFSIHTSSYDQEPFEGEVTAIVDYYDTNGNLLNEDFNLVEKLYRYANKTLQEHTYVYVNENQSTTESSMYIDRSWMLRAGQRDRFTLELSDVAEIKRITFYVKSCKSGIWNIEEVNVYKLLGEGTLQLNANSEYQSTAETGLLCSSNSISGYSLWYTLNGAVQFQPVEFDENYIEVSTTTGSWTSTLDYVPKSKDDSLNVYAHVQESAHPISSYDMTCAVEYGISSTTEVNEQGLVEVYSDTMGQTSAKMTALPDKDMFYCIGMKASGFSGLSRLKLKTDSLANETSKIDYAIVEHVRSGVIVGTYYVNFMGADAEYGTIASPSSDPTGRSYRQDVVFTLTPESEKVNLAARQTDLAVSFNYVSAPDPSGKIYSTPTVFCGEHDITSLEPGKVYSVSFNRVNVGDVTSLTFTGVGGVNGNEVVESAYVVTYEIDADGKETPIAWYSFATPTNGAIPLTGKVMGLTGCTTESGKRHVTLSGGLNEQTNVGKLELTFVTAAADAGGEGGTDKAIYLELYYEDVNGNLRRVTYKDLRSYLTEGSFASGDTAKLTLLVPGLYEMRYVYLEPYDEASNEKVSTWKPAEVRAVSTVDGVVKTATRSVSQRIREGEGLKVGLSDVILDVTAYISIVDRHGNVTGSERRGFSSTGEQSGILVEQGREVRFVPAVSGSTEDMEFEFVRLGVNAAGSVVTSDASDKIQLEGTSDVLRALILPADLDKGDYRVTFISKELPDVRVSVDVTVTDAQAFPTITATGWSEQEDGDVKLADYETDGTVTAVKADVGTPLRFEVTLKNSDAALKWRLEKRSVNAAGNEQVLYLNDIAESETDDSGKLIIRIPADFEVGEYQLTLSVRDQSELSIVIPITLQEKTTLQVTAYAVAPEVTEGIAGGETGEGGETAGESGEAAGESGEAGPVKLFTCTMDMKEMEVALEAEKALLLEIVGTGDGKLPQFHLEWLSLDESGEWKVENHDELLKAVKSDDGTALLKLKADPFPKVGVWRISFFDQANKVLLTVSFDVK